MFVAMSALSFLRWKVIFLALLAFQCSQVLADASPEADPEPEPIAEAEPEADPQYSNNSPSSIQVVDVDPPPPVRAAPAVSVPAYTTGPGLSNERLRYVANPPGNTGSRFTTRVNQNSVGPRVGLNYGVPGERPNYGAPGGRPNYGVPGGRPNYGGQVPWNQARPNYDGSYCEMTNKCCGMDKEKCCFNGGKQKCYTVWERKCEREDVPECQIVVDRHCHDVVIRDCRIVHEIEYRSFPVVSCFPKPLTECFEYQKTICLPTVQPEVHTINWINEKLYSISETEEQHCFDQKTLNCTSSVVEEMVVVQEKREREVPDRQKKCKMVPICATALAERTAFAPQNKIAYNQIPYGNSFQPVPQRVPEQVSRTFPGSGNCWVQECAEVEGTRKEIYFEPVSKLVNKTKETCEPVVKSQCHNYTVPAYGVTNETKSDQVTVSLPACHKTQVKERYCHTFPTADIGCRNSSVSKGFRINKVICDKIVTKQECFNIPVADCRMSAANKCEMVPREVCQKTCSDSPLCNQCDAFRNEPGFGSCTSSTCGNYYSNDEKRVTARKWTTGMSGNVDPENPQNPTIGRQPYWNNQGLNEDRNDMIGLNSITELQEQSAAVSNENNDIDL